MVSININPDFDCNNSFPKRKIKNSKCSQNHKNKEREMKFMNLVLLIVSFCCMLWGIYNYSELQKLEFKTERTFMEIAKELDKLKK